MSKYHFAYFTKEDVLLAEQKTKGIIGHADIIQLLEQMDRKEIYEVPWFNLSETDRDLINGYCGISPRFYQEIKIKMLQEFNPKKEGWPFTLDPGTILEKGKVYFAKSNPQGAISALSDSGHFIGAKPEEFEFISAPDWVLQKHGICPICFKKGVKNNV